MQSSFFPAALIIAFACHALIIGAMYFLIPDLPDEQDKSIPVVIVSASKASTPATTSNTSSQGAEQTRSLITTASVSEFKQLSQPEPTITEPGKLAAKQYKHSTSDALEMPSISQPHLTQSNRTRQANKGFKDIFGKTKELNTNEIKQISESKNLVLSDYEQSLLRKMAESPLYDSIYEMKGQQEVFAVVELILFPNGQIKNAKITTSSENRKIDALITQIAFNQSPYKKPPKTDYEKGFKYLIPISVLK